MQMFLCGWPTFMRTSQLVRCQHLTSWSHWLWSSTLVIYIHKCEILLCIGNKEDLLPSHSAHREYRRHLLRCAESSGSHRELDSGISETEGSSLLGGDDLSLVIKRSCLDWCIDHNIEYTEACAANADFDKCLSIDGDSQGVERLYGALSAFYVAWNDLEVR